MGHIRKCLAVVSTVCLLGIAQAGLRAADAPSADVAQLEKRVADLEKQNKVLLERIAALEKSASSNVAPNKATAPATAPAAFPAQVDLFKLANSVPAQVLPQYNDSASETRTRQQLKDEWYKTEVVGKAIQMELEVDSISPTGVISGHSRQGFINNTLTTITASCTPAGSFQLTALGLKKGQSVIIVGKISQAGPTERINKVTLLDCMIK